MTRQNLSRAELLDLHSVLRRAAEWAERNNRTDDAEKLAREVLEISLELEEADR